MENPIKMDDLGVPLFWKHPNIQKKWFTQLHAIGIVMVTCKETGGKHEIISADRKWKKTNNY